MPLTYEQCARIRKARGKRVRFRVQLASEQHKTRRRGMVSLFKIDHKCAKSMMSNAQREIDDIYRQEVGEPPILVGVYDPEVDPRQISEDISVAVVDYMTWREGE